ncbi:vacuolar membrane protein-domain-containing protein [Pilobolus umbonatus]|nr:vacuolar membrane protein-domain-containing protein [Pilobolus umbonatus]
MEGEGCKLLDSFAIFVQILLACLAFSTLIIKRQREKPQRPLLIWSLDVSKQVIGGIVVHTLNLLASHIFGRSLEGEPSSNPCVWYFLNIFIDTTLGVGIIWGVLSTATYVTHRYGLDGFQSGVYGEPPLGNQLKKWIRQLSVYVLALITMKTMVVFLFSIFPWLEDFGSWVLGWTMGNYRLQVLFVMLLFPFVMNIVQFWVVDTIVKHNTRRFISLDNNDIANDMLISDGEYEEDELLDINNEESANTPRPDPYPLSISDESLYELRTGHK